MNTNNITKTITALLTEIKKINSIEAIIQWDQETYMPEGAGDFRAEQISYLSELAHHLHTNPKFKKELSKLVDLETGETLNPNTDNNTKFLLYLVWKDYKDASALPPSFVKTLSLHTSKSQQTWVKAKQENNFKAFAPYLEKMIRLKKQEADYYGYTTTPYDALLDKYEPKMTSQRISSLFNEIRTPLVQLVQHIKNSPFTIDESPLKQPFDIDKQWDFGLKIAKLMGFNFNYGRQDKSAHPFTTSFHPTDVRITTRLTENNFKSALFATIHETGHALYEQGLPTSDYGTPFGDPISHGIHESQSRLWENQVGRSKPFWNYFFPQIKELFPIPLKDADVDNFYRMINTVSPSLIRVEADEVTYSLHIMLRFEMEKLLIDGNLTVNDLPDVWNQKTMEYLGLTPPTNKEGVLQDIHWSMGAFGYFPTYALGNLYAAPIMKQAAKEIPGLEGKIETGDLLSLREWLREKIHTKGRRRFAEDLIVDITGTELSAKPFMNYLLEKYSKIYCLESV